MPPIVMPVQLPMFDAVEIPLTQGYVTSVDPIDADLAIRSWRISQRGYAINSKNELLHRVIASRLSNRSLTELEMVDHINRDKLDNRRSNLRICTQSQNMYNSKTPVTNKSGYKGVSWSKSRNKWRADISVNNKSKTLGYYDDILDAYNAYCQSLKAIAGEFARFE